VTCSFLLQTNFAPILATAVKSQLGLNKRGDEGAVAAAPASESAPAATASSPKQGGASCFPPAESGKHHSLLMELLSEELDVNPNDIVDFELNVGS
jgi:aspartyl aminopeptidase